MQVDVKKNEVQHKPFPIMLGFFTSVQPRALGFPLGL
jgi:hypothetical protein